MPPLQVTAILCLLEDCLSCSCADPGHAQGADPEHVVESADATGGLDLDGLSARLSHQSEVVVGGHTPGLKPQADRIM